MSARIGVAPGPLPNGPEAQEIFWGFVDACEESDIDSIWVSDLVAATTMNLEVMTALAAIVGRTRRIHVGTNVLALPLRHPTIVAKELATIDLLSGGRILPAVSPGLSIPHQFEACGVSQSERGRRTDEAIVLIRRLWSEEEVTHEGAFYQLHNVTVLPRPYRPLIPIWIGGRQPAAWKRVGWLGNGWLPSAITTQELAQGIAAIQNHAQMANRETESEHYGATLGYYISSSQRKAEEEMVVPAVRRRTDVNMADCSLLGSPEEIIGKIKKYIETGATKFVLRPMCQPQEMITQLHLLFTEVVPHFHQPQEV